MAGAIIQLVAYGIQNAYLTDDPQITFFKTIYRTHTNFAIESIKQNFSFNPNFGDSVSCTISNIGDLISKMILVVELPAITSYFWSNICANEMDNLEAPLGVRTKFAWARNIGFALIRDVSIEIGSILIDKQYGEWLYIWSQLTNRQDLGLNRMVGNIPELYNFTETKPSYRLYIPLEFWFCRYNGLALPLISLLNTNVTINLTLRKLNECCIIGPTHSIEMLDDIVPFDFGTYIEQTTTNKTTYGYVQYFDYLTKRLYYNKIYDATNSSASGNQFTGANVNSCRTSPIVNSITGEFAFAAVDAMEYAEPLPQINLKLVNSFIYVDTIYLDTEERARFARSNVEYLIEQLQTNEMIGITSPNVKQKLTLNHCCKSHYWVCQLNRMVGPGTLNDLFNYTTSHVRYPDGSFFGMNLMQSASMSYNGHQKFSERDAKYFNLVQPYEYHYRGPELGIMMYSFSLEPELYQPSGSVNMSKINSIEFNMRLNQSVGPQNTCKIRSYTTSYNILKIMFNLAGIVFN